MKKLIIKQINQKILTEFIFLLEMKKLLNYENFGQFTTKFKTTKSCVIIVDDEKVNCSMCRIFINLYTFASWEGISKKVQGRK